MSHDEDLMTALYHEHVDVLHSFVSRYVDDASQVDDVVQETLLRTWRTIGRLDVQRGSPRAYLMTVARNVLTDRWRAAQARPVALMPDAPEVPTASDVDSALERWLVDDALHRLTPDHRAVIQALYFDGRTVEEAGRVLGIPVGTVKSRCYYAIRALRAALDEMGVTR